MPKKPKSLFILNRITIPGFVISVSFAILIVVVPSFLKTDPPTALIIGLIGIIITLLIDYNEKLKSVAEANELANYLQQDPEIASELKNILEDAIKVKQSKSDIFIKRMTSTLENCGNVIHGLSEGESSADPTKNEFFRLNGVFLKGHQDVYIVQGFDPDYMFKGVFKTNYLDAIRNGVGLGINIQIIWLQPSDILATYRDDILEQARVVSGNDPLRQHVRVLDPSDYYTDPKFQDYGLVDNEIVYFPQPNIKNENLSNKPGDIEKAKDQFEKLWLMAIDVDEYFNQPGQTQPSSTLQTLQQPSPPLPTTSANPPQTI